MIILLNLIPAVVSIIMLVNSVKLIKGSKIYVQSPANTPFAPIQKLQSTVIAMIVICGIIGFNFVLPLSATIMDEFYDGSEYEMAISAMLEILLVIFYIAAIVTAIVALSKFSPAKKLYNQILAQNNAFNNTFANQGYSSAGGFPAAPNKNGAYPQNGMSAGQNLNGFKVAGQSAANDVPEGYEAPPDINGYYGGQKGSVVIPVYPQQNMRPVRQTQIMQQNIQSVKQAPIMPQSNQPVQPQQISVNPEAEPSVVGSGSSQSTRNNISDRPEKSADNIGKTDIDVLRSDYRIPDFTEVQTINPFEGRAEKRCSHCGVVNPEKNKFCEFCGKEL